MKIDTVLQILLLFAAIFGICRLIREAVLAVGMPRCVTLAVDFDGSMDERTLLCLVGRIRKMGRKYRRIIVLLPTGREISEQTQRRLDEKGIKIYRC